MGAIVSAGKDQLPLAFEPKKSESKKALRRSNSLYESIVFYLDKKKHGRTDELSNWGKEKESSGEDEQADPRIAAVNAIAADCMSGNMRAFKNQCIAHFPTINRRFKQEWELNSQLHIMSREAYMPMLKFLFDDNNR